MKPDQNSDKGSLLNKLDENKKKVTEKDTVQTFMVTITETLERKIAIDAKSAEEAEDIIRGKYKNEEYVLDSSDFTNAEFSVTAIEPEKDRKRGGDAI